MFGTRDVFTPCGYEALVPTTAKALTVPNGARYCSMTVEVNPIRLTTDGTTATTLIGQIIHKDKEPLWFNTDLSKISLIEDATGALVKVLYFK